MTPLSFSYVKCQRHIPNDIPAPGDALTTTDASILDIASPTGKSRMTSDLIRVAELQGLRITKSYSSVLRNLRRQCR